MAEVVAVHLKAMVNLVLHDVETTTMNNIATTPLYQSCLFQIRHCPLKGHGLMVQHFPFSHPDRRMNLPEQRNIHFREDRNDAVQPDHT